MEIQGKISNVLPIQEGISKNGSAWKKQEFVIETTNGQYVSHASFTAFGEAKIANMASNLVVGKNVVVSFDIDSREFNGKWYTTLNAWKVADAAAAQPVVSNPAAPAMPQTAAPVPMQAPQPIPAPAQSNGDELPF